MPQTDQLFYATSLDQLPMGQLVESTILRERLSDGRYFFCLPQGVTLGLSQQIFLFFLVEFVDFGAISLSFHRFGVRKRPCKPVWLGH